MARGLLKKKKSVNVGVNSIAIKFFFISKKNTIIVFFSYNLMGRRDLI